MRSFCRSLNRRSHAGVGLAALALAVGLSLAPAARAQDDQADPPTRVGRIAVVEGTVSFHPTPDDPWAPAAINYPVAQAGQLWVEPGSRAEIGLGEARVRIDGGTEVDIVQFDDQNVVLSVPQGRADIYLHGRHPDEHYIVETPRGNVEVAEDGHYRIFAGAADAPTRVAAFHGMAAIAEPQTNLTINRGEEAVIAPTDPPSFQVTPAAEDPFDHWGEERERRVVEGVSYRYVSADMPGAADLDQYGTWRDDPQYGHVWIPSAVEAGWAPYHNGHWASVAPWGWTWVDDAPWGFAPFHYGRWTQIGDSWGWIPGENRAHPVYAPALVAWVGNPGALVVGGGGGGVSVGWIPLGPREVWVPPYHTSIDYVRAGNAAYVPTTVVNNISVTNITVIHNNTTFVNQRNVTVVPQQAFASAQPVQHTMVKVEPAAFTHPIAAASAPAKMLPPPTPAAHIASPLHAASAPPAASVPLSHPITPTNNLPKLAPVAAHPGPATPAGAPHPGGTPTPTPAPNAAPGAPHPGGAPIPTPAPNVAAPHPGGAPTPTPAPNAAVPHPGGAPTPTPAPSGPGPHPVGPAPAPGVHPATPTEPMHPATPTEPAHPATPTAPAGQFHPPATPEPPAHGPTPAPQMHAPTPVPEAHPAAPAPQFHPPAPAPQVHAPEPPHPAPAAPAPQFHAPTPAPQVHAPEPPHPAGPAPQAAHPPGPAPAPQAAHPAAAQPPKKDDKKEEHH